MSGRFRVWLGAVRRRAQFATHHVSRPLLAPAMHRANARWRASVISRGMDETGIVHRSLLVVAPHPDDETIGCGATIARRVAAGMEVTVVVVSDGGNSHRSPLLTENDLAAIRRAESLRAMTVLGVPTAAVRFLSFDSIALRTRGGDVTASLAGVLREVRPDEILTTSGDEWSDEHRLVHAYVVSAASVADFRGLLRVFPIWHWDEGPSTLKPWASPFRQLMGLLRATRMIEATPRAAIVRVGDLRARKKEAFACYVSQTTSLTGESSWTHFSARWIEKFLDCEVFFGDAGSAPRRDPIKPR